MTKKEWRKKKVEFGYFNNKTFGILKYLSMSKIINEKSVESKSSETVK